MSFLRRSLSTFGTQVFLMVMGMATGIITARVLGPELKGQAAMLTMIAQILFMIGGMGLGSAFSFFIAKKLFPPRQILTFALVSAVLFGSVGITVFYTTWHWHAGVWSGIPDRLVFYAALLAITYIYANYLTRIVVGFGRIYSMNMGDLAHSLVNFFGVVLLLLVLDFGLEGVMIVFWVAPLAQVAVLLYVLRGDLRPTRFWRGGLLRASLDYGIKSHALLLINFLNYRLDMLLLKYYSDASAVGFYSLAVGMAELMWLVPNAAVAPLFSGVASSDAGDCSRVTLRTVRWSLIFLVIMALGGVLVGRPFIALLYGADFLPSFVPFLWLLPGICLFPIFKLLTVDLAARGYPGYGTVASAAALATNIGGNILLIPRMGMAGAALATTISYSCMSLLCLVFFVRKTGYGLRDIFLIEAEERQIIRQFVTSALGRWKSGREAA
jgi:O-antigen/teichoic acid export membrane protein